MIQYTFSYKKPHRHFIDIEMRIFEHSSPELIVQLPAWRPGRYELGNFAKNIQYFKVFDAQGHPLKFQKITKDTWKISTANCSEIVIQYNYYANELNAGSTYLDEIQLYVNPINCCLYIPDRMDETCIVNLEVPSSYKVACSLAQDNNQLKAKNFDELVESYSEQIEALIDGGVDILLVETIFDTLNAKAALFAITGIFDKIGYELPVMVSGTITDASGRTLSGQTAEAFVTSVSHLPLLTIGFNCALGAELMLPYMKRVSRFSNFFTAAFPNAGLPNAFGEYDESSIEMGEKIKKFLDEGCVNIIGGCCGTTPEHIKVISELVKNYKPRKK